MPVESVNYDKHDVVTCDERGRATLGSEYANEQVFVYVAELPDPGELEEPSPEREREAEKIAGWAVENNIPVMDIDENEGTVKDKQGEWHQTPYGLENDE